MLYPEIQAELAKINEDQKGCSIAILQIEDLIGKILDQADILRKEECSILDSLKDILSLPVIPIFTYVTCKNDLFKVRKRIEDLQIALETNKQKKGSLLKLKDTLHTGYLAYTALLEKCLNNTLDGPWMNI
jgi:hypothetical protein